MSAPRVAAVLVALATLAAPGVAPAATPAARTVGAPPAVLPVIAADYTRAVAEARARKLPLFIEAWAPW
ncbi:MAG: hypothetical protein AAB113_08335 [Candidatus Eisenbacteria bacterium]